MTRRSPVPLFAACLLGVAAALISAGWLGRPSGAASAPAADQSHWLEPVFVQPTAGWLPRSADDPRPAFDVRNCAFVPEIYDLGPARDAIPALEGPAFIRAAEATWLDERDPVLGLKIGNEARCYPLRVLNYHSLLHDRIAGQAIYVFWDPPSGAALARRQWSAWRPLRLAGLGFRGTGLAFDPANGALWDLFGGGVLSAPGKDVPPELPEDYAWLPLERMTWRAWRMAHANTLVLSQETGMGFNYRLDPYAAALSPTGEPENYWNSATVLAPEALRVGDELVGDKAQVLAFFSGEEAWAAPVDELAMQTEDVTVETAAGPVTINLRPRDDSYYATDAQGRWLPQMRLFWFAWKARFPETELWHPEPEEE